MLSLTSLLLLPFAISVATNGTCGPNFGPCDGSLCCSGQGICGSTANHCELGCQPLYGNCSGEVQEHPIGMAYRTDFRCGSAVMARCPPSRPCCSKDGICGTGPQECETGCQISFGKCDNSPPVPE